MSAVLVIIALGLAVFCGWGLITLLCPRPANLSMPEQFGLSWLFGSGMVSLGIWLVGMVCQGTALLLTVCTFALVVGIAGLRKFQVSRPPVLISPREKISGTIDRLLMIVIAAQFLWLCWWSFHAALLWDAQTIWEGKGWVAFLSGGRLPPEFFPDQSRVWTQQRYPLHLSYIVTWLYLWLGRVDEAWVRILGPMFAVSGVTMLYGVARDLSSSRRFALVVAASLFFIPFVFSRALAGYADLPLGILYLAAVRFSPALTAAENRHSAAVFAIVAALLPWMKTEGTYLWCILFAANCFAVPSKEMLRCLVRCAVPGLVIILGFKAFLVSVNATPATEFAPLNVDVILKNSSRYLLIVPWFGIELSRWENWSLLWPGVGAAFLSLAVSQQWKLFRFCVGVILVPLAVFATAYLFFTSGTLAIHLANSVDRLLLQLAPVAIFVVACAAASTLRRVRPAEPEMPVGKTN